MSKILDEFGCSLSRHVIGLVLLVMAITPSSGRAAAGLYEGLTPDHIGPETFKAGPHDEVTIKLPAGYVCMTGETNVYTLVHRDQTPVMSFTAVVLPKDGSWAAYVALVDAEATVLPSFSALANAGKVKRIRPPASQPTELYNDPKNLPLDVAPAIPKAIGELNGLRDQLKWPRVAFSKFDLLIRFDPETWILHVGYTLTEADRKSLSVRATMRVDPVDPLRRIVIACCVPSNQVGVVAPGLDAITESVDFTRTASEADQAAGSIAGRIAPSSGKLTEVGKREEALDSENRFTFGVISVLVVLAVLVHLGSYLSKLFIGATVDHSQPQDASTATPPPIPPRLRMAGSDKVFPLSPTAMQTAESHWPIDPHLAPTPAKPPVWLRIDSYRLAIGRAAKLEWRSFVARRAVVDARHALDVVVAHIGAIILEQGVQPVNDPVTRMCRQGKELLGVQRDFVAKIDEDRAKLNTLDSNSPAAQSVRATLKQSEAARARNLEQLDSVQLQIGRSMLGHLQDHGELQGEQSAVKFTSLALDEAELVYAACEAERREHDAQLGVRFRVGLAGTVFLFAVLVLGVLHFRSGPANPAVALAGNSAAMAASKGPGGSIANAKGLTRDQLALASVLVETRWTTWRPGSSGFFGWTATPDAEGGCGGSAGVVGVEPGGRLVLITNRHVLDLASLAASKANGDVAIKSYAMRVKFPSGQVRVVQSIGHETSGIDVARIVVDGRGLIAGIDYVVLPRLPANVKANIGDDVVAVGNPGVDGMTYESTQTFGRISGFRDHALAGEPTSTRYVQTDVAINHGNSGGPLFVKSGDLHYWLGVNTLVIGRDQGYQGINFAIDAGQAAGASCVFYDASPSGTANALSQAYDFPAGVYR